MIKDGNVVKLVCIDLLINLSNSYRISCPQLLCMKSFSLSSLNPCSSLRAAGHVLINLQPLIGHVPHQSAVPLRTPVHCVHLN